MKIGIWQRGGECPNCQLPIETSEWCWEKRALDKYRSGSEFSCCPHCGKKQPIGDWPQAVFRRVKDGWFSPWRWQKWQEPVVSGVEVRFAMKQPEEGRGT